MKGRRKLSPEAQALVSQVQAHRGRWHRIDSPERDQIRVMAVVEGYVVARYPAAAPFVTCVKEWMRDFRPVEDAPR